MSGVYRSGLRGFRPPLANGGHCFVSVPPPDGWRDNPEAFPETPGLWRCVHCHLIVSGWEIRERFVPRPCMGDVAEIPAPA